MSQNKYILEKSLLIYLSVRFYMFRITSKHVNKILSR